MIRSAADFLLDWLCLMAIAVGLGLLLIMLGGSW